MNTNEIFGKLNVVSIDISSWSGGAHLKKEDIGVDIPDRAFSLGRKYLIAPERLVPFTSIRKSARLRCQRVGTRFLDGFAVPDDPEVMQKLIADLEAMRIGFETAKADLLSDFDEAVAEWISEPEVAPYEGLIRAAMPSLASIERKIQFDYSVFQVGIPESAPAGQAEKQVAALGRSLFSEAADAAKEKLKSFLKRNDGASSGEWTFDGKTPPAIGVVRDKLKGLEFLDARVPPVVDEIDRVLAAIPAKVKVEGAAMRSLYSLLVILSDEERMLQLGEGLLSVGTVVEQEFGQLTPAPEQTTMEIVIEQEPAQEEPNQASDEEVWQQEGDLFVDQEEPAHVPVMPVLDLSGVVIDF